MSTETQPLQTDHINFKDFDKGYAPFAEALRSLGFNWQIALTEDLKGFCRVLAATPSCSSGFLLPRRPGGEVTERTVISDLWSGVSETLAVNRQKQPGKLIKVRSMQLDGSTLTFSVS
jgi:hypothetical protein